MAVACGRIGPGEGWWAGPCGRGVVGWHLRPGRGLLLRLDPFQRIARRLCGGHGVGGLLPQLLRLGFQLLHPRLQRRELLGGGGWRCGLGEGRTSGGDSDEDSRERQKPDDSVHGEIARREGAFDAAWQRRLECYFITLNETL